MSIRRSAAVILTAGAIAASVLAATPAQASVRVDWDDPLTTTIEKAPKTKISKGEYKRLHKGQRTPRSRGRCTARASTSVRASRAAPVARTSAGTCTSTGTAR